MVVTVHRVYSPLYKPRGKNHVVFHWNILQHVYHSSNTVIHNTHMHIDAFRKRLKISLACQTRYNPPKARPCKCQWETYPHARGYAAPAPFVFHILMPQRTAAQTWQQRHPLQQPQDALFSTSFFFRCSFVSSPASATKKSKRLSPKPSCRKPFIGKTSGTWHERRDHRTSWARSGGCQRPAGCGRTGRGPASAGSWSARRRTSGSRR